MNNLTKQQQQLAKIPAAKRVQILEALNQVRGLLAKGYGKLAAQHLAYARRIMTTAINQEIPQAIRYNAAVVTVRIVGSGKHKRYSAYTSQSGWIIANTGKAWAEYYNLRLTAKQERAA